MNKFSRQHKGEQLKAAKAYTTIRINYMIHVSQKGRDQADLLHAFHIPNQLLLDLSIMKDGCDDLL
jgi:hypothetical protein